MLTNISSDNKLFVKYHAYVHLIDFLFVNAVVVIVNDKNVLFYKFVENFSFSGQTTPTKYLWVGNIPIDVRRVDLEYAFARHGQIRLLEYGDGDPAAVVIYNDIEDAAKARTKLSGTTQFDGGRVSRGLRIDFLDRPTTRRFVIVRARPSSSSFSSGVSDDHPALPSPSPVASAIPLQAEKSEEEEEEEQEATTKTSEILKKEPQSPQSTPIIKQRRSTDRSETPILVPTAGRTFYPPLGSYLSTKDTQHIQNIPQLMELCEQLNYCATHNSTALSTVYPVQFILKSHGYDARMHFLAGSPTLASIVLGKTSIEHSS